MRLKFIIMDRGNDYFESFLQSTCVPPGRNDECAQGEASLQVPLGAGGDPLPSFQMSFPSQNCFASGTGSSGIDNVLSTIGMETTIPNAIEIRNTPIQNLSSPSLTRSSQAAQGLDICLEMAVFHRSITPWRPIRLGYVDLPPEATHFSSSAVTVSSLLIDSFYTFSRRVQYMSPITSVSRDEAAMNILLSVPSIKLSPVNANEFSFCDVCRTEMTSQQNKKHCKLTIVDPNPNPNLKISFPLPASHDNFLLFLVEGRCYPFVYEASLKAITELTIGPTTYCFEPDIMIPSVARYKAAGTNRSLTVIRVSCGRTCVFYHHDFELDEKLTLRTNGKRYTLTLTQTRLNYAEEQQLGCQMTNYFAVASRSDLCSYHFVLKREDPYFMIKNFLVGEPRVFKRDYWILGDTVDAKRKMPYSSQRMSLKIAQAGTLTSLVGEHLYDSNILSKPLITTNNKLVLFEKRIKLAMSLSLG
ncbi:uncharacterized protein LOC108675075 [Hyalella azteca]|uniref:Uncharacterized protein LOC108675075 n=1 Tax=Hyalella azteca TaxID=294128 RepID=A0A8B7NXP9_HYAAZ|nr:uncharacterized protein LOC108675075 [Hyalella azteca]